MLTGRILAESTRAGSDILIPGVRVTRVARVEASAPRAPGQPAVWTLIDVEAPGERAGELASAWAAALLTEGGWYADLRVGDDHVIVFPGRSFRYAVGDAIGRRAAVEHGRSIGVPPHQLDWGP